MRTAPVIGGLVLLALAVAACSSTLQSGHDGGGDNDGGSDGDASYPIVFMCDVDGGADCPRGQTCPEVPLSSTSCGDLPGVLGHETIPQTAGRPLGCWVALPYGNPYFGDSQVTCLCTNELGAAQWLCPI